MTKDIILRQAGLVVSKEGSNIVVEYTGDLNLVFKGSLNLTVDGEVNLLGNAPINIDAPKDDETNHIISLNSRLNKNIKDLPTSIAFREKAQERSERAFAQVQAMREEEVLEWDHK